MNLNVVDGIAEVGEQGVCIKLVRGYEKFWEELDLLKQEREEDAKAQCKDLDS
ncbi:hypothetical protein NRK67_04530 [Fusobacteria bacterium ZRK30]|nr:hypothetical protein NRK67_04530 [Fusobacteria bacterium ZRK30]